MLLRSQPKVAISAAIRLSALPLSLHPPRRFAPAVDRFAGAPIPAAKNINPALLFFRTKDFTKTPYHISKPQKHLFVYSNSTGAIISFFVIFYFLRKHLRKNSRKFISKAFAILMIVMAARSICFSARIHKKSQQPPRFAFFHSKQTGTRFMQNFVKKSGESQHARYKPPKRSPSFRHLKICKSLVQKVVERLHNPERFRRLHNKLLCICKFFILHRIFQIPRFVL